MKCRRCKKVIPDISEFCLYCGTKQGISRNVKTRGNGTGSVYKRGRTWTAMRTIALYNVDGKPRRTTASKGGFKTKAEAINYLPLLMVAEKKRPVASFSEVYEMWLPTHRAGESTITCYKSAYKHFSPVHAQNLADITVDDLQSCLDDCGKGRRTKENMKALAGLIYKYAIPRHYLRDNLNMGQYLIVSGETGTKEGLPVEYLDEIKKHVGSVFGADYVLCQCYLGFRPSEFIALDAAAYNRTEKAFVGGGKTDAGTNRTVTISPKIQPYIDSLMKDKIGGPVFPDENGRKMDIRKYRALFYSVLEACGLDNPCSEVDGVNKYKYTPHSCRHTFATLMKRVEAASKDKLELIGHTSDEMLRHYQDVNFADLRKITDAI